MHWFIRLTDHLEAEVPSMPIAIDKKYFEKDVEGKFDFTQFNWEKVFRNHQCMRNEEKWSHCKKSYVNIDLENDPVSCVKVSTVFYSFFQLENFKALH